MIRVVIYLVIVGLLALGAAWLADRPGEVAITWQGLRIETSLMVMGFALAAIVVIAMLLWALIRNILRSPDVIATLLRNRRGARGYSAISQGLIAIGSGDMKAARRYADEARRIAPNEPLTLLLGAQAAQLAGDRGSAERTFRAMAGRDDTKLLGLHGLFMEARRRGDAIAARLYAEEAAQDAPALGWAGHAVLEFRSTAGDWTGALDVVERNMKSGLIDKAAYRRQRAVLLTARAMALEEGDRDSAKVFALEAVKLAPDLVPAADMAGRFLGEANDLRKAGRIIDAAWKANPHPDLADTYAHLRFGDSARDRLKRVQTLAAKTPGHVEGALAVARAALDAQEFLQARAALQPLLAEPTQRVAMLMAALERAEHDDEGRAREWMTRAIHAGRDPAWTADGVASDRWMPVSPVTGRLDAFVWRVPVAELGHQRLIEDFEARPVPVPVPAPIPADPKPPVTAPVVEPVAAPSAEARVEEPPPAAAASHQGAPEPASPEPSAEPRRRKKPAPRSVLEPVIPLVRAPDDPGPDAESEDTAPPAAPMNPGWRRVPG